MTIGFAGLALLLCCGLLYYYCCMTKGAVIDEDSVEKFEHSNNEVPTLNSQTMMKPGLQIARQLDFGTNDDLTIDQSSNVVEPQSESISEFLQSINLFDKYHDSFTKAGIQTVDDFMEFDPYKLKFLNINEQDLDAMLCKVQEQMEEEDKRNALIYVPKSEFDVKAGNKLERIQLKRILKELGLERKHHQSFLNHGIDTVEEFLALDVAGLEKLNVDHDELDTILTHIQSYKDQEAQANMQSVFVPAGSFN